MTSDLQFYENATEEQFKPYIINLGGDWGNMNLREMNTFMYTQVKENPRLTLIQSEIIDEAKLMSTAQLLNFGSYFPVYSIYDINTRVDRVNITKMTENYDYIFERILAVDAFLNLFPGEYPTEWTFDNQEFVTSHPASHFKNHTWGDAYDTSLSGAFNYPEESGGWEGLGLGMNETSETSTINFFDKQDGNLEGKGFETNFWSTDGMFNTPWPNITASNQSNRSARNSYIVSRAEVEFSYDGMGTYTDYLYFIEVDFRLEV